MSEIVGRHLKLEDAKDSAVRMREFWNEEYRVYSEGQVFIVERGWPKHSNAIYTAGFEQGCMISTAPLECMYCQATGPEYPIDADHPGWMCDACYERMQNDTENEG